MQRLEQRCSFLTFWRLGSQDEALNLVRVLFLALCSSCRCHLATSSEEGAGESASSLACLLVKGTNPIMSGPTIMTSFTSIYLPKAPSPNISTYMLGFQHMNMMGIQFSPQQMARGGLSSKKEPLEQFPGRCEGERMRRSGERESGRGGGKGKDPAVGKSWFKEGYLKARGCREEEWGYVA